MNDGREIDLFGGNCHLVGELTLFDHIGPLTDERSEIEHRCPHAEQDHPGPLVMAKEALQPMREELSQTPTIEACTKSH